MEETICIQAGKIWHYLASHEKIDVLKLKFDLKLNNSMLFMAVGWLARENKIKISQENEIYFITLVK